MNEKYRIIAAILARGGSKGLPGKNIIDLGGKPLLAYTIEAALSSKMIDSVVVSTDYENIRSVGLEYGAEVPFLRPPELSGDKAHTPDATKHVIEYFKKELGKEYDIVITLQPTSPFRNGYHIDESIEKFLADKTLDSLISIKKQEYPPWWMFQISENRIEPAFHFQDDVNVFNLERQQFPTVYRPNGAIYVTWVNYLIQTGSIVNPVNNGYYEMNQDDSIDIDTPSDYYAAQFELKKRSGK